MPGRRLARGSQPAQPGQQTHRCVIEGETQVKEEPGSDPGKSDQSADGFQAQQLHRFDPTTG
ncbi:MAG: hypothetical protein ACUVSX_04210 [Aggregatilineales bacterium]